MSPARGAKMRLMISEAVKPFTIMAAAFRSDIPSGNLITRSTGTLRSSA
jgi:hypothetical protein